MEQLIEKLESTTNSALIEVRKLYEQYDYAKWRTTEYETELSFMADHPNWVPFPSKKELLSHIDMFETKMDDYLKKLAVLEPVVEYLEKALEELRKYGSILQCENDNNSEEE